VKPKKEGAILLYALFFYPYSKQWPKKVHTL